MKKPMAGKKTRVFLDSNVLLSGLFSDKGAPRLLLDVLCLDLPVLAGVTGQFNVTELERNLRKKMPAVLPIYRAYFPKLKLEIIPFPSKGDVRRLAGAATAKDIPVLASAISGDADYLVTGDKKLYLSAKEKHKLPFKIVSPPEFLRSILPEILKSLGQKH